MQYSEPKKHGKKAQEWVRVRAAWVRNNPPSHEGYYVCGICGKSVHKDDMELDHINPRSSSFLSTEGESNLQPTHSRCNHKKGSRHLTPVISREDYEFRKKINL